MVAEQFQVAYLSEKRAGDAVLSRKQQTDGDAQPRTMDPALFSAEGGTAGTGI